MVTPVINKLANTRNAGHRYLATYGHARTHSQTGGLLQLWTLRRFGSLLSLQPFLLGLIFLTRQLWTLAGVLLGLALAIVIFVELACSWNTREPSVKSLSEVTQNALDTFRRTAKPSATIYGYDNSTDSGSSAVGRSITGNARGDIASVLEMMSITLAVSPRSLRRQAAVPLPTERLDDMFSTDRAARTHPGAVPHLGPLVFTEKPDELEWVCYAPELIAPRPLIWLPNDRSGVANSELQDLKQFHSLDGVTSIASDTI